MLRTKNSQCWDADYPKYQATIYLGGSFIGIAPFRKQHDRFAELDSGTPFFI